ncbi:hypothetical protein ACG7TL_009034 [Trametes sanguinea]
MSSVSQGIPEGHDAHHSNGHNCDPKIVREQREPTEAAIKEAQQHLDEAAYALHEKTLERYQQELDALLVYAGLFSGILTAFNVEAYELLRPDATESGLSAIRELTAELRAFALTDRTQAAWIPPPLRAEAATSFKPPSFVVWLNCLWFASLVISLSAATIALLVKQWLYEARTGISAQSRASTQLLQYRISSVEEWKVWNIALLVPLLLQVALLIFLVGLLILLNNLHAVVATVSTAFASTLFAFLIVVTLLPAFHPGCCYRSPQARIVALAARPLRNLAQYCARWCARRLAGLLSGAATKNPRAWYAAKDRRVFDWLVLMLQKPLVTLSRAPRCRSWQDYDQLALRIQSDSLNVQTAVTAWHTTLDPAQLGHMRVALGGEAGAPLVRCLRHLGIKMVGDIGLPPALRKRNVRGHLGPLVLAAIRQMFTIDRDAEWEPFLQKLLNVYTYAEVSTVQGSLAPPDERTLQTACDVLMEVSSIENLYAALSYLSSIVDVDGGGKCTYARLSDVFSATERWVGALQDADQSEAQRASDSSTTGDGRPSQLQRASMSPQATLIAFRIVAHCMLRIAEPQTKIADAGTKQEAPKLEERARVIFDALPRFLPSSDALVEGQDENVPLCNELAFGLHMLVPLLALLSRAAAASPNAPPSPEMVSVEVANALVGVWRTAEAVLERPPPSAVQSFMEKLPVRAIFSPVRIRQQAGTPESVIASEPTAEKLARLQEDIARFFPRGWTRGQGPVALPLYHH